jgi:hypothetical protein
VTRTFQYACEAIEAATRGRDGGYRLALDSMLRELADGGAGTAEITEWQEFVADLIAHPQPRK